MDYSLNRVSPRIEQPSVQPSLVQQPSPRIVGSDIPQQRVPGHTPKLAHTFEKSPLPVISVPTLTPTRAGRHSSDSQSHTKHHSHDKHHDSDKHHSHHDSDKHHSHVKHSPSKPHMTPTHPTAVMSSDLADKYQNLINVLSPQPVQAQVTQPAQPQPAQPQPQSPRITVESPRVPSESPRVTSSPKIAAAPSLSRVSESPKLSSEPPRVIQPQQPQTQPVQIQTQPQQQQNEPQGLMVHKDLLHHVRIWPSMWSCLQGAEVFIRYRSAGAVAELAEQVVGKIYPIGEVMYFSLTDLTPKTRKVSKRIPFDDVVEVWKRYPAACVPEFLLIQASMRKYDAEIAKLTAANAKLMDQVMKLTVAYGAISK